MLAQVWQIILQTVVAFFVILIITRILDREQLGQLTFYDYITGITIGSLAADIAIDTLGKRWLIFVALLVFGLLTYLMGYVSLKNRVARKLLEGEPTIVVQNGKIMEKNMRKIRYNVDDLLTQLREKEIFNISDVEFAVLESNGQLSVLRKSQKKPVTREDLNLSSQYEGLNSELIIDGEIIYPNLQQNNLDESWLINELQKQGIKSSQEVLLASLDTQGNLYVDKKDDNMKTQITVNDDSDQQNQ